MISARPTTAVRKSIVVNAPVEHAFATFTEGMGSWWPADHHIYKGELAEMVVEPRAGGRIFDRGTDGTECQWATVVAFEPPHRFVFTWNINLQWQIETDPTRVSEVEVTFHAEGADRTRVELEHRNLERHGEGWEEMQSAVDSPEGWSSGLGVFAAHLAG